MGLNEDIGEIKNLLQEQEKGKKEKKFKIPFGKRVSKGQAKKDYVTVLKLSMNKSADFKKVQIVDQAFMESGVPRLGTTDEVFYYKGKPLVILPEWSVKPLSPTKEFEKSLTDGSNINGYKILLAKMIASTVSEKKKMGGWIKWVIGLALAGIVIYAILG